MVFCSEYYGQKAQNLHERERDIKAARGKILDANGMVLATNKSVCTISVIHSQIEDEEAVVKALVKELGLAEEAVRKRVEKVSSIERVKTWLLYTSLDQAIKEGKTILLEGQLGTLKDPDHGIYPMVTSSSTLAAYGAIGAGIPPYEIKQIVTVCKAYSSAVGAGAFVSEIFGDEADELRRRGGDGGEFGATTGRQRRMGWFDCVASKYGCRLQGTTDVAFTVLDVLDVYKRQDQGECNVVF